MDKTKSKKAMNGQDRDVKNWSEQVRYWRNRADELKDQLTESEKTRINLIDFGRSTNLEFIDMKSRAEKAESVLLDREKDYNDLKEIQSEKGAQIRELKQKCDSFENMNKNFEGLISIAEYSILYHEKRSKHFQTLSYWLAVVAILETLVLAFKFFS